MSANNSNKIVLAGGTGFIGSYLKKRFMDAGYEVVIVSRTGPVDWNDEDGLVEAIDGAMVVINLAGKSVDCRYTEKNKKLILESRTLTTLAVGRAIKKSITPPKLWINASTATIYRHAMDKPMTESKAEIGDGFSVDVAKQWEAACNSFELKNTRKVILRIPIVLGKGGGFIAPVKRLVKYGFGGRQGRGDQMFSWVHIEDLARMIDFIIENNELSGAINCSSPNPVTNETLMKEFREVMGVSFGLPTPSWFLELGAALIQTETELIFKSRWVIPERLLQRGFEFKYPLINEAIKESIMKA